MQKIGKVSTPKEVYIISVEVREEEFILEGKGDEQKEAKQKKERPNPTFL